ncbi:UNVERIFIED_CONTAM: Calcineurin-binding protein 1 [Sesamum latifolium]|uniref:Calcineurin-binding protein 1 n=1 Tax=Sesamum latifolium TaxID=2727402 RepID=A0AAW2SNY2_9LAMI
MMKIMFSDNEPTKQQNSSSVESPDPYQEVYRNLYYLLAQSEEISETDKWAGFVLTKEGEEFVEHNANLFKYDLLYNPMRFESWQRLANIYVEEVDLLLNDGSKQINVLGWRKNATLPQRVETSWPWPTISVFTWKLLHSWIPVDTILKRRGIPLVSRCVCCFKEEESLPHLFLHNPVVLETELPKGIQESLELEVSSETPKAASCLHFKSPLAACLNTLAELKAIYRGLQLSIERNITKIWIKTDAQVIIKLIANPSLGAWYLQNTLMKIRTLLQQIEFKVSHIFREGNQIADLFANQACLADELSVIRPEQITGRAKGRDEAFDDYLAKIQKLFDAPKYFSHLNWEDWSHAFYVGKLCEILGYSYDASFSYYAQAIALNPSAVDPFYRMHASQLKLLYKCGKQNEEALKVVAAHSFAKSAKDTVTSIFDGLGCESSERRSSALPQSEIYACSRIAQERGTGDLEKAKEEFSFCFKSSRSSFTINMWEIDSMVKKGRRKNPGPSGNKRSLEVNLAESSRKFITCIRKYILFYLKLLEETGDVSTLDRAYISLCADKRFSLCLEHLVPVSLGRSTCGQIFGVCQLKSLESTESSLYGYIYQYIQLLERNVKVETLEAINEKIRKLLKNPKLSNSNCAKTEIRGFNLSGGALESEQLLCVDLQTEELWSSAFEDPNHLKNLETKWNPSLSKIKNVIIKRVSDEDLEAAATLLRSSYNFYKDTSCALLPSGINLYMVPAQLATETYIQPGIDGVDILDMNTSRKLLLWAYSLLHGYCTNVSHVIKYCEENAKSRMKKGAGGSSTLQMPTCKLPLLLKEVLSQSFSQCLVPDIGGTKDAIGKTSEQEAHSSLPLTPASVPETHCSHKLETGCSQKEPSTLAQNETTQHCAKDSVVEKDSNRMAGSDPEPGTGNTSSVPSASVVPFCGESNSPSGASSDEKRKISSATPNLLQCSNNPFVERSSSELQNDADRRS